MNKKLYKICSRFVVFALAFAIPVLPGPAVEPGLPSRTAVMTAAARAIGTYDPDPSVRNPDWLAEHFLGPTERRLLDGTPWLNGLAQDYRELTSRSSRGVNSTARFYQPARSRSVCSSVTVNSPALMAWGAIEMIAT